MSSKIHGFKLNEESLSIIKHVTNQMPNGFIMFTDRDTSKAFVNDATLGMLGCSSREEFEALADNPLKEVIVPEDYEKIVELVRNSIAVEKWDFSPITYRIRCKDGSLKWFTSHGHYRTDDNYGELIFAFTDDSTGKYLSAQENIRKSEVIKGLALEYNAIYLIDFQLEKIFPYSQNNAVSKFMQYAFNKELGYSTTMQEFADSYVFPEDYKMFIKEVDQTHILQRIACEKTYDVIFRRYNEKHSLDYVKMTISRTDDKNRFSRVIMTFKNITDEIIHSNEAAALARSASIIHALETEYVGLVDINLETEEEIRLPLVNASKDIPKWSSAIKYSESCAAYANTYVAPEDRAEFLKKASIENLRQVLGENQIYTIEYALEIKGERRFMMNRYTLSKDSSGVQHIFIGTRERK